MYNESYKTKSNLKIVVDKSLYCLKMKQIKTDITTIIKHDVLSINKIFLFQANLLPVWIQNIINPVVRIHLRFLQIGHVLVQAGQLVTCPQG